MIKSMVIGLYCTECLRLCSLIAVMQQLSIVQESWPSGRRQQFAKLSRGNPSQVRILYSPPLEAYSSWLKRLVLKTRRAERSRGFESYRLRQMAGQYNGQYTRLSLLRYGFDSRTCRHTPGQFSRQNGWLLTIMSGVRVPLLEPTDKQKVP